MNTNDQIIIYKMSVKQNNMDNYGVGVLGGITEGSLTVESAGRNEVSFTTRSSFYNSENLKPLNVVRVKGQLFRIHNVSVSPLTNEIFVEARHILYDLNEPIGAFQYEDKMKNIIQNLLGGYFSTVFEVVFDDHEGLYENLIVNYNSEGLDQDLTITSAILNLIQPYGLIMVRDNHRIIIKNINGVDVPAKLVVNWENIECFRNTKDSATFYTRVWPIGNEGLELPEKFIYVEGLEERPPQEITKKMYYDTDSLDELRFLGTDCALKMGRFFDNFSMKLSDVVNTEKYKHIKGLFEVNVGDVVAIMLGSYREKKRIINKKTDLVTGEIAIELGDTSADFIDSMVDEQKEMEQRTRDLLRTNYFSYSNYSNIELSTISQDIADITFGNNLGGMNSKLFFNGVMHNKGTQPIDVFMLITYKDKPLAFAPKQTLIPGYNIVNFTYPLFDVHQSERVVVTATATGNATIEAEQLNVLIDLFGGSSAIEKKSPDRTVYQESFMSDKTVEGIQTVNMNIKTIERKRANIFQTTGVGGETTTPLIDQTVHVQMG